MTTASKITMVRVVLIPFFIVFLLLSGNGGANADTYRWIALAIFVVASLSDFLDGYVARHYNQVTDFGKFFDTLADKLLVTACLLVFVGQGRMASWIAFIVVAREFAIMGLRSVAATHGRVIAAGWSGKIKTAVTMAGICTMLFFRGEFFLTLAETYICASFSVILEWVVVALITVTTLYSGIEYFVKNKDVFKS